MKNALLISTALTLGVVTSFAMPCETAGATDCLLDTNDNGVVDIMPTDGGRIAGSAGNNPNLACGINAKATGAFSTSLAHYPKRLATAVGTDAATTANNQVTLNGTRSALRIGDIAASTAAQSGPVDAVTGDGNGVLEFRLEEVDQRARRECCSGGPRQRHRDAGQGLRRRRKRRDLWR